jgi:hypothetical protein
MNRRRFESDTGPMTPGTALRAGVRLVCWCNKCLYRTDVDALVTRLDPELPVPTWGKRLRCSKCGSHDGDFVVIGDGGMPREEQRWHRRTAERDGAAVTATRHCVLRSPRSLETSSAAIDWYV